MSGQIRACDDGLSRRSILGAVSAVAALPFLAPAAGAMTPLRGIADLVGTDGGPSDLARSLARTNVSVRGYLAPSLDGRSFSVTEGSVLPCQLCGAQHDAGPGLIVHTDTLVPDAPVFEIVEVSGRLEVEGAVRLADARIRTA
jgi:hypothetical protein